MLKISGLLQQWMMDPQVYFDIYLKKESMLSHDESPIIVSRITKTENTSINSANIPS